MLNFHVSINGPSYRSNIMPLMSKNWRLTQHKTLEIEFFKCTSSFLTILFRWSKWRDHAGLIIELALLGFEFNFSIRDNRHWDYKNHCWENYGQ